MQKHKLISTTEHIRELFLHYMQQAQTLCDAYH